MRKKFKIFYSKDHPNDLLAGKEYKSPSGKMVVMNSSGLFFLVTGMDDPYYGCSIKPLHQEIGNYDVVWS